LVDYTGTAWVDGTTSRPEAFLDAEDTSNIAALRDTLAKMKMQELTIGSGGGYSVPNIIPTGITDVSALVNSIKNQQIRDTGNSFGAHLHFQVEVNGSAVDPLGYL